VGLHAPWSIQGTVSTISRLTPPAPVPSIMAPTDIGITPSAPFPHSSSSPILQSCNKKDTIPTFFRHFLQYRGMTIPQG